MHAGANVTHTEESHELDLWQITDVPLNWGCFAVVIMVAVYLLHPCPSRHPTLHVRSFANTNMLLLCMRHCHLTCWNAQSSLFAYWLWSCVVTVLILLTKYWRPRDVTLLNYFLKPRGITSACWKCSTDGRSISLAATIRPPPPTQSPTPEVDHIIPQCQEYVYFKNAGGSFCSSMAFRLFVHDLSKLVQKWSDLWWKWHK